MAATGQVSDARARFELVFQPNLGLATAASRCALAFFMRSVRDSDALSRLRVALQELLENAALYATNATTRLTLGMVDEGDEVVTTIRVVNRADAEDIARLKQSFDDIDRATDRDEHYQVLMRRVARGERLAGLGLGRIYAEPGMRMGYEVDGDEVTVIASARCPKEVGDA